MKKIVTAGNSLTDLIKWIDRYPERGMLAEIREVVRSVGGSVPNTGITLKTLAPEEISVTAISRLGKDENGRFIEKVLSERGILTNRLVWDENLPTSFTDVMTLPDGERTFFCAAGANAAFSEADVSLETLDCEIFHVGYLLLLETLDSPDEEYGTKLARLLSGLRSRGVRTSVDAVSGDKERFRGVVLPALPYCDYVVVNEIEAGYIAGIPVREGGRLLFENLRAVCEKLIAAGVKDTAVVHCPELGCSLTAAGKFTVVPSLELPRDYIKGAVGAGDAFCAGMLYSFLSGMTEEEALRLASCAAACNLHAPDSIGGARSLSETCRLEKTFGRKKL